MLQNIYYMQEMKRKAGMNDVDELMDEDADYNSDEDEDYIGSSADNLKVFCVSSTEYQKMKNIIPSDGTPTVRNPPFQNALVQPKQWMEESNKVTQCWKGINVLIYVKMK